MYRLSRFLRQVDFVNDLGLDHLLRVVLQPMPQSLQLYLDVYLLVLAQGGRSHVL